MRGLRMGMSKSLDRGEHDVKSDIIFSLLLLIDFCHVYNQTF